MNMNRFLKQTAVYWSTPVADGEGGFAYDNPVQIDCRWSDKQERFLNPFGEEVLSMAVVTPDRDVDINGYLWLGTIEDLSTEQKADPQSLQESRQIVQYSKVPNIKGDTYRRKVWL